MEKNESIRAMQTMRPMLERRPPKRGRRMRLFKPRPDPSMRPLRPLLLLAAVAFAAVPLPASATDLMLIKPRAIDLGEIQVTTPAGDSKSLEAVLPEGPALVHFWATWCAPCGREMPAMERFAEAPEMQDLTSRLIVISLDRASYDRVAGMLRERFGVDALQTYQDTEGGSPRQFGVKGLPSTALLDADHRLVALHAGVLDWDDAAVRAELVDFLDGDARPGDPNG